jgi:ABC-type uncharacterized transport system permease subunit
LISVPIPGFAASLRAHAATTRLAVTAPFAEGIWTLFIVALRFIRVLIMLAIWRTLIPSGASVSGYGHSAVLAYALVGEVFAPQLNVLTPIQGSLWNGAIAGRFTWPMPVATEFAAEMIGDWAVPFLLVSLPLLLLSPVLGVAVLPASVANLALFCVSLVLAIAVGLAIDMAYAVVTVRLGISVWLLDPLRGVVQALFSGAWVPLALLPFHLGAVFDWLPFASVASAPLRIYVGTGDPPRLIALQAGWLLVLGVLVREAWRRNRERVALYGG